MRQLRRRILAMVLAGLVCISLLPGEAFAEAPEEGTIAPVAEPGDGDAGGEGSFPVGDYERPAAASSTEGEGSIAPVDEAGGDGEESALCKVTFVCEPMDALIMVYDPTQFDGNGEERVIEPEEDGTWLLEQGEYFFSAARQGCESVEKTPFSTAGKSEKTINLTLLRIEPIPGSSLEEDLLYEPAYPLPALTGDGATDTANVAQSQLGYTKSGGTVYGAWWNDVTNWGVDYTYADWCAMFACWCAYQAGAGMDVAYNKNGANANLLMNWQFEHASGDKEFATNPKAGDFLFFGNSNGVAGHVAIVKAYDESAKRVYFIGGNQGSTSCVSLGDVTWGEDSYWGSQVVLGYGRPNYTAVGATPIAGLDTASGGAGVIQVSGWAIDPDEPESPVTIRLCVGGPLGTVSIIYQFEAKEYREGLEAEYPGAGPYHGFSKTISVDDRGTQMLYFYACDLDGTRPETLFATAEVTISTPMLIFYTVSYDANGGTGAPDSQVKSHDVPLTLSTVTPTRESVTGTCTVTLDPNGGTVSSSGLTAAQTTSYAFKEWNTSANGSGVSYAPGANYTANAGATLYAQWNSSTSAETVTLLTPTRRGYLFRGWATDKDAASGLTGSYTPTGDVTFYAIWEADPDVLLGDMNGDGQVDLLDLVRLRKHLAGIQVELNEICADLDGDGEVDGLDLMQLRKLLVGVTA